MNPKIEKLRAEREKNVKRITSLQARNRDIDNQITALEDTDIVGMVREYGIPPDELAELLIAIKKNPLPQPDAQLKKEQQEKQERQGGEAAHDGD